MLIITFDEHGGCYDHVVPPEATPPSETPTTPFNFNRYGVRVPAVVVSPYVKPGSIIRSPTATPYDHTSIMATLRKRFPDLGPPLTARVAGAPDLGNALTLSAPINLGPVHIDPLLYAPSPSEVARAQEQPLSNMQKSLVKLAANLPPNAVGADPAAVAAHVAQIQVKENEAPVEATASARDGAAFVKRKLGEFFTRPPVTNSR
jgi:phospholipase C